MNGVVIIGSGSRLYKNHFRDKIQSFCNTVRLLVEYRGRDCIELIPSIDTHIYVVFSDPKIGYVDYHQSLNKRFKNLILISSSAVLCGSDVYSYVKRKIAMEFIYKMNSQKIFRVGLPEHVISARNISLLLPEFEFEKFIDLLENPKPTKYIVNGFNFKKNTSKFRFIGRIYYLLLLVFSRPLLRPVDLVLKVFGFVGYGYSFYK